MSGGFTLLPEAAYRRMPWRNGLGETIEIAVSPAEATLESFDWRISMARVEADGPFSRFPEVDRTLLVLDGEGMELAVAGHGAVVLGASSEPFDFPADVATSARLRGGPITDLNVMTRRGRAAHRVRRMTVNSVHSTMTDTDMNVLLCVGGRALVTGHGGAVARLEPRETLIVDRPGKLRVEPVGWEASLVLIGLSAARA